MDWLVIPAQQERSLQGGGWDHEREDAMMMSQAILPRLSTSVYHLPIQTPYPPERCS